MKIALLASGTGTNAENIIKYSRLHDSEFEVCCVITNQKNALVIDKAKNLGIDVFICSAEKDPYIPRSFAQKIQEEKVVEILKSYSPDWICLAGYMRILSSFFLQQFYDPQLKIFRVINIHPSLLPQFPGMNAYERAFFANVAESGVTIHLVDEGVDTGPILAQRTFKREKNDSFDNFVAKGRMIEHQLYPLVLEKLAQRSLSPITPSNIFYNEW